MAPSVQERLLIVLLRIGGVVTSAAFLAVFLPVEWMSATHQWLGLGEFPRAPVVDYLARSIAVLYGFHGVLLLIIARDPARHLPIVRYVGVMNLVFGLLMVGIDIKAALPAWWTLTEGPPIAGFGAIILYLSRSIRTARALH